jgi:hypothetical protein
MSITSLSPQQLRRAANLQEKILELQAELNAILGGEVSAPIVRGTPQGPKNGRRKVSAEARSRMAAAQKARRAAERGESQSKETSAPSTKPKRKMSKAAKAKMSAAAKARWKNAKAAGKSRL